MGEKNKDNDLDWHWDEINQNPCKEKKDSQLKPASVQLSTPATCQMCQHGETQNNLLVEFKSSGYAL